MLNISQNAPVEVPFTDDGKVVKINGKPIILKVAQLKSTSHRNAIAEYERLEIAKEDQMRFYASRLLEGAENLLNNGEPLDCYDNDLIFKMLDGESAIIEQILVAAQKKPWTLELLSSTPENSDG